MSISNSPLPPLPFHANLPFTPPLSGSSLFTGAHSLFPAHLSPSTAGTPPASAATPTSGHTSGHAFHAAPSLVFANSSGGADLQPTTVANQALSTAPNALNMANLMNGMSPMLALATQKDSRWLTLEVCREYQRNKCSRTENECKFAHPPPQVEVQNGRVTACFDSIKGKCQRKDPPCKYLHPPQHLREQLLANGRNNLILKNTAAILAAQQAHVVSAQVPYHQAIISATTGLQPQVGGLMAPQFNPYLSSAHGHTALSLHSALVPHAHQSSNQPTSAATQGFTHQQPQGQSDGSTAQHQLVQQQINVIPSPAIVNAQKLQRTDRLELQAIHQGYHASEYMTTQQYEAAAVYPHHHHFKQHHFQ